MKRLGFLLTLILLSAHVTTAQEQKDIISLFKDSRVVYDDNIGFETHYYLTGPDSHKAVDGKIRRQFCEMPDGVSAYELIKNYEQAIQSKGGTVIYFSEDVKKYRMENGEWYNYMTDGFARARKEHPKIVHGHFVSYLANKFVAGKIATAEHDIFISVAAADGYYELVTVIAEPMDMNNVSLEIMNEGIADKGKIAIYDIYFDTAKSEVKSESINALAIIADYLKANMDKKFLIVGHTDNTGDFQANITLSDDRAKAVIEKLVTEYGIEQTQLIPYGVGSVSPQMSNSTDEGKARNRRVELVEL
ncbi:MAG: OmpA family protein [Bacteroidota bacterium]